MSDETTPAPAPAGPRTSPAVFDDLKAAREDIRALLPATPRDDDALHARRGVIKALEDELKAVRDAEFKNQK